MISSSTIAMAKVFQRGSLSRAGVFTVVLAALLAGFVSTALSRESEENALHDERWFGRGWEDGSAPRRDILFSHKQHSAKEKIACVDCHEGANKKDRAGMPEMELCAECHGEESSEEGPGREGCLLCHTFSRALPDCTPKSCTEDTLPEIETAMGPKPYLNLRYPSAPDGRGFSHQSHAEAEITCADCHGDIDKDGSTPFPSGKYMPTPQRCLDCHAKDLKRFTHQAHQAKGIECEDCHEETIQPGTTPMPDENFRPPGFPLATPPECAECHEPVPANCETCHIPGTYGKSLPHENHRGAWLAFHGAAAEINEAGLHGRDCYTCHGKNDCTDCHTTELPRSHTNFWRTRGHGFLAAANRESCATCHRQDYCVRCHNETAPRSHMGSWESRHCTWCHLDSGSSPLENCKICHRQAIHASAPHRVTPGLNCTACH